MSLSQVWLLVCIVMVVFELITVGNLVSIWFAIGALAAFLTAYLTESLIIQIIVFVIVSLASMVLIRPLATRFLRGNVVATNADSIVGRQFVLADPITEDKWGLIRVNGDTWSATTVDQTPIDSGVRVEVIAIEGVKLIVRKLEEN